METPKGDTSAPSSAGSTVNSSTSDTSSLEVEVLSTDSNGEPQQLKAKVPDTGYLPLQDFMGMSNPDDGQKEKLQYIWESFAKGRDRAETLEAIKEAKYRLSPPLEGENYLHKLYSYTRLIEESRSINKEKAAYER